jgi:uncharacterized membrane protein
MKIGFVTIEVLLPLLGDPYTKVRAINAQGVAVGSSGATKQRPILWKTPKPEMLTLLPGYVGGEARAILVDGRVVGTISTGKGEKQGGTWEGKKFTSLRPLSDCKETEAIVAAGDFIVGYCYNSNGESLPTLWNKGVPTPLATNKYQKYEVKDVNEMGIVIGTLSLGNRDAGVVWHEGKILSLDKDKYQMALPNSINAKGEIVGSVWSNLGTNQRKNWAARWDGPSAKCVVIPPREEGGTALDITPNGTVVGAVFADRRKATVWEDGKSIALNMLLPKKSPFLELDAAYCISEDGKYIAGLGTDAHTANFASYRLQRP